MEENVSILIGVVFGEKNNMFLWNRLSVRFILGYVLGTFLTIVAVKGL